MKRWRMPVFWRAVAIVAAAYLFFAYAIPPLMPKSLLSAYMFFTVIGVLLYYSFDEARFTEFKVPILAMLRAESGSYVLVRRLLMVGIPLLAAYVVYGLLEPVREPPVEIRQIHPAPPAMLHVYGKTYDLGSLNNPVRAEVLNLMGQDPDAGWQRYQAAVDAGAKVYYRNCVFCHGDRLSGQGVFAKAFDPMPANFQDVGTIAQLQESYLFWRITTGGAGLPEEGTPWNSAMPAWQPVLTEAEVWDVITFLYDYVGHAPRMWDAKVSGQVAAMRDGLRKRRAGMMGDQLYQLRCAACHGRQGAGDGPAADRLYPRPRDFTTGLFKYKTSPSGKMPRDEDLFNAIKFGMNGTAMPAWGSMLSDEQIDSLIPVIKRFDVFGAWVPADAADEDFGEEGQYLGTPISEQARLPAGEQIPFSEASVARGKELFHRKNTCSACHGQDGRGNITSGKKLKDDWKHRIWPRNLTKPWTWRVSNMAGDGRQARDATIRIIFTRLSVGIPGTPMPEHTKALSEEDRWHVANYVYSLRTTTTQPDNKGLIIGARVEGMLPHRVDDDAWNGAEPTTLLMAPNIIKDDRLFTPLNDAVTVQALYNDEEIAFLLTVDDRTDSRSGEPVSMQLHDWDLPMHADALAIQFPGQEDDRPGMRVTSKPSFQHGDPSHPVTIWYWNAGSFDPFQAPRVTVFDAAGLNKRLRPRRQSEITANGEWQNGQWKVVMKRSRKAVTAGDVNFVEGSFIPVAFANWDGSNGEAKGKHSLTAWHWLFLPPEDHPLMRFGLPAGTFALIFAGGLMLVRSQRRKS